MTVFFNMIPVSNSTQHMLQIEDANLQGTCGPPLPINTATVVDCTSGGVLDLATETVYTWVQDVELNIPTFCALSEVTPRTLTMICWTRAVAAGKLSQPQKWVANASGKRLRDKSSGKKSSKTAAKKS